MNAQLMHSMKEGKRFKGGARQKYVVRVPGLGADTRLVIIRRGGNQGNGKRDFRTWRKAGLRRAIRLLCHESALENGRRGDKTITEVEHRDPNPKTSFLQPEEEIGWGERRLLKEQSVILIEMGIVKN